MMTKLLGAACLLSTLPLAACATYPGDAPIVENGPTAPVGTWVGVGQPVYLGPDIVVTPTGMVEDSRCPQDVQCVWAGRVVATTRVDGPGWRETVDIETGKSVNVRGYEITPLHVAPENVRTTAIPIGDYRFHYTMEQF